MNAELDRMLDRELRNALERNYDVNLLREILVKYREKNFSSGSVYSLLDAIRIGATEDIEDRVLGLMDIVSGFCYPYMRVW
ncbi:hypothetical protein C5188_06775 [Serratia liquefaciens]|uniref:hypothetical protein n=1 Tax=Serratia liquefaciens TaxID=614 RepID=UPI000D5117CF|nr:hypothetical protein [Serratia liquefaciens]PVD45788.1 hypothetical protein C5188_06775 [Serratia liquefaciens]QHT51210.1 hypothetical protein C5686_013085 [Serratia liquefaciens]